MASSETTPLLPTGASSTFSPARSSTKGHLSVRQSMMMDVANMYIHQGDSVSERKRYLDSIDRLKNQFRSLMVRYRKVERARSSGVSVGCSDEVWEALARKVKGKGHALAKTLDKSKPHKMSLKQVLDLVSFINTMELLLPHTPSEEASATTSRTHTPGRVRSYRQSPTLAYTKPGSNMTGVTDTPAATDSCGRMLRSTSQSKPRKNGNIDNERKARPITAEENTNAPGSSPITSEQSADLPEPTNDQYSEKTTLKVPSTDVSPGVHPSSAIPHSLNGGQCTPGGSCSTEPNPPSTPSHHPTPVSQPQTDTEPSGGQRTPAGGCSIGSKGDRGQGTPEVNSLSGGQCTPGGSCASEPAIGPLPLSHSPTNRKGSYRQKNSLGKILEEDLGLPENAGAENPNPAPEKETHTALLVRSKSHVLGSLLLNAKPRPKPTPADSLMYWVLQDHNNGQDISSFSRTGDGKSLFRLMVCLWAEPVIGTGPFDREWKRLVREREMKRWSEVGAEAEVSVLSVLVMMSLIGADVGLGLFRDRREVIRQTSNRAILPDVGIHNEPQREVPAENHPVPPAVRPPTSSSRPTSASSDKSRVASCPVCKRRIQITTGCPCAVSLLQGMGVVAPKIPEHIVQPANGRQSRRRVNSNGSESAASHAQSLDGELNPHKSVGSEPDVVHSAPVTGIAEDIGSTLDSAGNTASQINKQEADVFGIVMSSQVSQLQNECPTQPLLAQNNDDSTPASGADDNQTPEPALADPVDVGHTLHRASIKLSQYETEVSPESAASLSESFGPSATTVILSAPLTKKEVNIYSKDEQDTEERGAMQDASLDTGDGSSTSRMIENIGSIERRRRPSRSKLMDEWASTPTPARFVIGDSMPSNVPHDASIREATGLDGQINGSCGANSGDQDHDKDDWETDSSDSVEETSVKPEHTKSRQRIQSESTNDCQRSVQGMEGSKVDEPRASQGENTGNAKGETGARENGICKQEW
ncbi:hypothetical protein BDZ91DRAFT_174732 [Kalaharituber pfeilii]|nr:hypothetical protein BDZ91DRAFT_174732 [Kalaharituber pfeilii]